MDSYYKYLNSLVNRNKENFSEFPDIKWLNGNIAEKANLKREKLLKEMDDSFLFKETKPFYNQISKGCLLCGKGKWSCLFITGKCNAGCFYCPTSQLKDEVPSSQNLEFETADAYAEYINYFGFKGVSFSGGEPLLYFNRTLEYLQKVREKCNPEIYIWMYTNGILADADKFRKLGDAGLNEIRFDIGATKYTLDNVRKAKGIIANVTIEIPAVPEEKEKIKKLLPEMINAGVTNLNLHQLRLTKHNAHQLLKHKYTYIHAEQPIVLESELAALEIIAFAKQQKSDIGINYCSFFFKNRFQKAGFRNQLAVKLASTNEVITEKGMIREYNGKNITYKALVLSDCETRNPVQSVLQLQYKKYFIGRETALEEINLNTEQQKIVQDYFDENSDSIPADPTLFKIWQMDKIEKGLREY